MCWFGKTRALGKSNNSVLILHTGNINGAIRSEENHLQPLVENTSGHIIPSSVSL